MKAFITGITGMVGSHLADYLIDNTDWEIHGLIRWRSPLNNIENILQKINKKDRVYLHYGDLRDPQSINKVVSARSTFSIAICRRDSARPPFQDFKRTNWKRSRNLLACRGHSTPVTSKRPANQRSCRTISTSIQKRMITTSEHCWTAASKVLRSFTAVKLRQKRKRSHSLLSKAASPRSRRRRPEPVSMWTLRLGSAQKWAIKSSGGR